MCRVCWGRVCQGPSWLGAEFVRGRDVQLPFFWGWGSLQNWSIFRGHFYAFQGLFLKVMVQNGDIFGGLLKFHFFFGGGVLEIPDIFLG